MILNKIISLIKILVRTYGRILLYIFRHLLPINNNMIVFETDGNYSESGRVLFEYLLKDKVNEQYEMVWIAKKPKAFPDIPNVRFITRSSHRLQIKLLIIIATARCFIFTHPYWLKNWRHNDQIVINITHSTMQLKESGGDMSKYCDYMLCSSPFAKELKCRVAGISNDQVIYCGLPRNDLLKARIDISKIIPQYEGENIYLSMTTFRQCKNWNDAAKIDAFSLNIINTIDELNELNDWLNKHHSILICKIHRLQKLELLEMPSLSNILYLTDDDLLEVNIQLYELLACSDVLLTDYSSVYFDYLLLDRPIGFLVADMDEYSRGFCYEDPFEMMPGEKINTLKQLEYFFDKIIKGEDEYRAERQKLCKKVHPYSKDFSKRLWSVLEEKIFNQKVDHKEQI